MSTVFHWIDGHFDFVRISSGYVVAKDSSVVTITKSSPVFVNRGQGTKCMGVTWCVTYVDNGYTWVSQ